MTDVQRSRALVIAGLLLTGTLSAGAQAPPAGRPVSGCESCHSQLADRRLAAPVDALRASDVHAERGFSCTTCHAGDPSASDIRRAKDPAQGYRGKPSGAGVIDTCARCHSDAEFMRRYIPSERVDQASQYAASIHGQRLAAGDTRVATCASCHHAHGIRKVSDARSPVYPLNVASTCASCHADPQHMQRPAGANGRSIPTDQLAAYQTSVHHAALTERNDLSAPTCNDCHGNHGAAPPGVGTVANVCGTCHAVFAARFETSIHREIFDRGCVECHGNHAIAPPADAWLSRGDESLCPICHEEDAGIAAADRMYAAIEHFKTAIQEADELTGRVKNAGMEVSAQELALSEVRSRLTLARTELHTFDPAAVDKVIDEGLQMAAAVERTGQEQVGELRFRRAGLALFLTTCLLVVVAMGLKVRAFDRRRGGV